MKFLREHRLLITTVTPIHIGCGEDYTPTDYVIDENTLFAVDSVAVADGLPQVAHKKLREMLKGTVRDDALKQIQKLFYEQRESLMAKATHYLPVAKGVAHLYEDRIGSVAQRQENGNNVINKLEIERTLYNPISQRPIIPGSSLKGAIRTALLDLINEGRPARLNETNHKLQERLFEYQMGKLEKDPMRLINLADTKEVGGHTKTSEIRFAINRFRRASVQGNRTKAEDKGLYQLLETIPELTLRAYESRLTIQDISQLNQRDNDKLPKAELRWTIQDIACACNQFYLPQLQKELEIVANYVTSDWKSRMCKLIDEVIVPLKESNKGMLLRVGRHSGAEAVTLNGVRNIKNESQPRTFWLAAEEQNASSKMVPFGWLLIEIDPTDDLHSMLEEFTRQSSEADRRWLKSQQDRVKAIQARLRQQEQDEKEKVRRQEQARLAKEKEEQERQAHLASMTEEQRAVEELKSWTEEDRAKQELKPQGRVPCRLNELLNKATDWPIESRVALCDLAENIYRELGMLKGKQGKDRKARIQKLRE
ncbi:MAG: type III-A CRISPR-associated RAMP protein Csm5 [Nitrospira sp. SB0675_bin_23]|nr:type III-A CRISPR-associated RAMP protein Csm5 [Nitrospira sp. SB0675_bin_23]